MFVHSRRLHQQRFGALDDLAIRQSLLQVGCFIARETVAHAADRCSSDGIKASEFADQTPTTQGAIALKNHASSLPEASDGLVLCRGQAPDHDSR